MPETTTMTTSRAIDHGREGPAPAFRVSHSRLIGAIEAFWLDVRDGIDGCPDLPAVAITIGMGSDPRHPGRLRAGHFAAERWHTGRKAGGPPPHSVAARLASIAEGSSVLDARPIHEVFVAGELLAGGPRSVLATVLHEAAHALARARGIADTSRTGRYHNGQFRALAEELGLSVEQVDRIGWSGTSWNDTLDLRYEAHVSAVEAAITGWRIYESAAPAVLVPPEKGTETAGGEDEGAGPGRQGARKAGRVLASCGCGRSFRIALGVLAQGPITCGTCGLPFTEEATAEPPDPD
jgi:hypothetical protein